MFKTTVIMYEYVGYITCVVLGLLTDDLLATACVFFSNAVFVHTLRDKWTIFLVYVNVNIQIITVSA